MSVARLITGAPTHLRRLSCLLLPMLAAAIAGCGDSSAQSTTVDVLDFGRAFYRPEQSSPNRLYIEVESRMKLDDEQYLLLAPHPREQVFQNDGRAYSSVLEEAAGASEIIFMLTPSGRNSVVTRRYDVPGQPPEHLHAVFDTPYGRLGVELPRVRSDGISEITSHDMLLGAVTRGHQILAIVSYVAGGRSVSIDFPVKVLNINPTPATPAQQWQIASGRIPLYVPNTIDPPKSITNGNVAFSTIGSATLQLVYLCEVAVPRPTQDYACAINLSGTVQLYERL